MPLTKEQDAERSRRRQLDPSFREHEAAQKCTARTSTVLDEDPRPQKRSHEDAHNHSSTTAGCVHPHCESSVSLIKILHHFS